MDIGLCKVTFKVDTGADVSVINNDTYLMLQKANSGKELEFGDS